MQEHQNKDKVATTRTIRLTAAFSSAKRKTDHGAMSSKCLKKIAVNLKL